MDLFGWLLERNNPGPTGSLESHDNGRERTHLSIITGGMASMIILIASFYAVVHHNGFHLKALGISAVLIIAYLLIAYRVKPVANTNNTGVLGFINNPFRYTDDINRFLVFLKILLYPGRLIGIGLADFWNLIREGARP